MARHHGRCLMGQRCISAIPHGHWQSSTFIAALRHESIEAPFLIEGPVDAEVFTAYLEQVLCPQLREGDTLILDNLATHKIQNVGRLLSAHGVGVRYLPPYSPDPTPGRPKGNETSCVAFLSPDTPVTIGQTIKQNRLEHIK